LKYRALRLDTGNFAWGSEHVTKKTRLLNVVYNSTNNELVRTNTLVKNAIIQIDATPFRQWYEQHYGVDIGKKKKGAKEEASGATSAGETKKKSRQLLRKLAKRRATRNLDPAIEEQFATGRLYACIASRPGQSGRCDGYILEGKELEFYVRRIRHKKK